MTDKQKRHIAKIINSQLGWTNGWSTSDENYDKECLKAAERVVKYCTKVLKISINPPIMRCRHDFGRIVGYRAGKKYVMQCRKCGAKKVSGGIA